MALAVYQKDVAEWRNNMPTDLAAKMTRDKLYNLFPDVDKDTLTELLMAHDNNFKATVEVRRYFSTLNTFFYILRARNFLSLVPILLTPF